VHAIEGTISRSSEGTNNAFASQKSCAAHVSVGSDSAIPVMSAARPLFPRKRTSICANTGHSLDTRKPTLGETSQRATQLIGTSSSRGSAP
jgi:hypothetical protein